MAIEFKNGIVVDSTGTVLDVQGSQGQLFSVTDSLTGDLFSVSDISGVPILNVNSSGAVEIDGTLEISDTLTISTIAAATTDTDKFLVSDSGVLKFRTGAELLSDIGGQASGNYAPSSGSSNYAAALGADDNYVTDAEKTVIGNTAGNNSGDVCTTNHTSAGYLTSLGTALVDADFGSAGFMKTDGAGTYSIDTSSYITSYSVTETDVTAHEDALTITESQISDLGSYITSQRAISSTPTSGATTTSISSGWAFDNVKTAVPTGAVFTDTVNTLAIGTGSGDAMAGNTSIPSISGLASTTYVDSAEADAITAAATAGDAAYVALGGSTMTGALELSGAPTSGNHAATKTYVDNAVISDTNTTYGISCADGDNTSEEKIRLTDSGSGTDDVVLAAGTGLSIARSSDKITFTNTVSAYSHPTNAGNHHIPTLGATGNFLKYGGSSGTAAWADIYYNDIHGSAPTWNQSTTGSAASATSASTANGLAYLKGVEVPIVAHGVIIGASDSGLAQVTGNGTVSNKFLRSRGTGTAQSPTIAAPTFESLTYSDLTGTVPTFNQNTTGSAATAGGLTGLTASRVMVSAGNGTSSVSAITTTELGYLNDVTSNIQTQLDAKEDNGVDNSTNVTLNANVGDVLSISTQEISATDPGDVDVIAGWDHSGNKFTYLSASDVRTAINVDVSGTDSSTAVSLDSSLTSLLTLTGQTLSYNAASPDSAAFIINTGSSGLATSTNANARTMISSSNVGENILGRATADLSNGQHRALMISNALDDVGFSSLNNLTQCTVTNHTTGFEFDNNVTVGGQSHTLSKIHCHDDGFQFLMDHDGTNKNGLVILSDDFTETPTGGSSTTTASTAIGFNQVTPQYGIHDSRPSSKAADWYLVNGSIGVGTTPHKDDGRCDITNIFTGLNFTSSSDARLKKDIKNIPSHLALNVVKQLQGVRFNWLEKHETSDWPERHQDKKTNGVMDMGFIAQDVEKVLPEVVETNEDNKGFKTIAYGKMVAVLTEAIKEQQNQIDKLQKQIKELL